MNTLHRLSISLNPGRATILWSALVASLLLCPAVTSAQVKAADTAADTPAPAKSPASARKTVPMEKSNPASEVIELSPFVVNTEKDQGFMAANAGTATNLGLDMKDVPAAYSIMTRDFIDALNITNIQQASQWVTNGNAVIDGNGADVFNIPVLDSNRGVTYSGGQQRNYFLSAATMDSYSLERYEFGRGPNAALFNIGAGNALGGGIDASTKRARIDKNFETVQVQGGSWNFKRTTLDINNVLIPDKLAIRGNAVWYDRGGWRMREFEKTKGVTVGLTYKLTPKSELRFDFANDVTSRNIPQVTIFDAVTGWDGRTVFNGPVSENIWGSGTSGAAGAANGLGYTLNFQGATQGVNRQGGAYYLWSPTSGASSIINYQNEAQTRRGDDTANTPILWNGVVITRGTGLPLGNGGGGTATPTATTVNGEVNLLFQLDLPSDRFDRAISGSGGKFQLPNTRFTQSLDAPILTEYMKDYGTTFSHQFSDNLFVEVAGNVNQVHDRRFGGLNGTRTVKIDINQKLPTGAANPNYLQPFFDANIQWQNRFTDNAGLRAALGYIADAGKWGHYTVNFTGSMNERRTRNRNYIYSMAELADPRMWQGGDDQIRQRYYWSDASRPLVESAIPQTATIINWGNGTSLTPVTTTTAISPRYVLSDWNENIEKFRFLRLAASGRYFDDKLIVLVSTRLDSYKTIQHARAIFGDLPTDWNGSTFVYKPDAPSDWLKLSYVPIGSTTPIVGAGRPRVNPALPYTGNNNGVSVRDPNYAGMRFRDDYSSPTITGTGVTGSYGFVYRLLRYADLTFNYSTAYVPPPVGNYQLDNTFITPESGKGYDLGLRYTFFDGKLQVNTGYYDNRREHVRSDPPYKGNVNSLVNRNGYNDPGSLSVNSLGIEPITGTDYATQKNHGMEVEIVGTITRDLRLSLNVGSGRVVNTKRWPLSIAYVTAHAADYLALLQQAGGKLDTTQKPSGAPHAPGLAVVDTSITAAIASEQTGAVTDYNNIWINYEQIYTQGNQIGTANDRITANLFADYTFSRGWAKGLRLGLGCQARSATLIGYSSADTIVGPSGTAVDDPALDANSPIYAAATTLWTGTVGYNHRLKGWGWIDGKELQLQLVVNNLMNNTNHYYQDTDIVARPPGGDATKVNRVSVVVRNGLYQQPISFQLTATLRL